MQHNVNTEYAAIRLRLAEIALTSLEAEAAGEVVLGEYDDCGCHPDAKVVCIAANGHADWENFKDGTRLYTAPPAPVSVHDERYQHLSELYHSQEKRLFKLAQRIKGSSFDKYAHSTLQAIDVLESEIFGDSEDACRAAMLQGADGNSPVITDGWVACSERMPEEDSYVVAAELGSGNIYAAVASWFLHGRFNLMEDGISASNYDGGACIEMNLSVTHWMPLPAAPQQEVKS